MAWMHTMALSERYLDDIRREINAMNGHDRLTRMRRCLLMKRLRKEAQDLRIFLDDCLCGRNEAERSQMLYRVRLEFPLFHHLASAMRLFPEDRAVSDPPPGGN
jgi:hypothetical protein